MCQFTSSGPFSLLLFGVATCLYLFYMSLFLIGCVIKRSGKGRLKSFRCPERHQACPLPAMRTTLFPRFRHHSESGDRVRSLMGDMNGKRGAGLWPPHKHVHKTNTHKSDNSDKCPRFYSVVAVPIFFLPSFFPTTSTVFRIIDLVFKKNKRGFELPVCVIQVWIASKVLLYTQPKGAGV